MKKINLFISALMICMAILVAGGATVPALQFQAQSMAVRTASNANGDLKGIDLFDSAGRYAINREDLAKCRDDVTVVKFFGHDWYVVKVNGDYATFWMTDPYAKTTFNETTRSGSGVYIDGTNVWHNGYSQTYWTYSPKEGINNYPLGQSDIRKFLANEANKMFDGFNYKNKVYAGHVDGINESDTNREVAILSYSDSNLNNVTEIDYQDQEANHNLIAYYGLDANDSLWLPSVYEIRTLWGLPARMLGWTDTTVSGTDTGSYAWLRTPDVDHSYKATCLNYTSSDKNNIDTYFFSRPIKQEAGVRPAIHLNIAKIDEEYQEHLDAVNGNGNKGGWFDKEWLMALFIVVCILGLVGVGLVIIAVILKAHKQKAEQQQA